MITPTGCCLVEKDKRVNIILCQSRWHFDNKIIIVLFIDVGGLLVIEKRIIFYRRQCHFKNRMKQIL